MATPMRAAAPAFPWKPTRPAARLPNVLAAWLGQLAWAAGRLDAYGSWASQRGRRSARIRWQPNTAWPPAWHTFRDWCDRDEERSRGRLGRVAQDDAARLQRTGLQQLQ